MKRDSQRIVIIGAGVIGLCAAYYCARRGHRVTVIDRHPEARDGCSFGNAGMVVPSHFVPLAAPGMVALGLKWMWNPESPFYIQPRLDRDLIGWAWKFTRAANAEHVRRSAPLLRDLSFASRACFEELAAIPDNDFGLVKKGLVMLCRTQRALDHEAAFAEQANRLGVPAQVLDATGVARLDPNLTLSVVGGVYFPKDCHLSPDRFMTAMKRQCEARGVRFVWSAGVNAITHHASRITEVSTASDKFTADEVVLCSGAWSPLLARQLGLKLPMQAGKGYSLTLPHPRELPQICSILTEARVAVTPMNGRLRFGGTMEIAGLNEQINPARIRGIIRSVTQYCPRFTAEDFAHIQPWCGLRPCSPDGLPYLGRTANFANLTIATGHAMMGLSLGPITGQLVSEIVSGGRPEFDLRMLDPDRYG